MEKAVALIKREGSELLPGFLFFLATFNLIVITDALTTERYGIEPFRIASATVLALLVAKVLLLANHLPFMNAFSGRPLIYNTLWKTLIYLPLVFLFRYIENLIGGLIRHGNLAAANHYAVSKIVWPQFWAITIWLIVLFCVFVAFQELSRALGPPKLRQMFLGR